MIYEIQMLTIYILHFKTIKIHKYKYSWGFLDGMLKKKFKFDTHAQIDKRRKMV
jgi:hypothetical protein